MVFLKEVFKLLKYILFPAIVFLVSLIFLFTGLYSSFPWLDIPLHFIGGFAVGSMFFFFLKYFESHKFLRLNKLFLIIFVVSLVALTTVVWEFYEFLLTFFTGLSFQGSLEDTMLDFALGIFGGFVSVILFERLV